MRLCMQWVEYLRVVPSRWMCTTKSAHWRPDLSITAGWQTRRLLHLNSSNLSSVVSYIEKGHLRRSSPQLSCLSWCLTHYIWIRSCKLYYQMIGMNKHCIISMLSEMNLCKLGNRWLLEVQVQEVQELVQKWQWHNWYFQYSFCLTLMCW
jgi:mitochondrial fission protein ELM1